MSADTEVKTISMADEWKLYKNVHDACKSAHKDYHDVLDAIKTFIALVGDSVRFYNSIWLRACSDTSKFDIVATQCQSHITDIEGTLSGMREPPLLHQLAYWGKYSTARHYVKNYKPDLSLVDLRGRTIVRYLCKLSVATFRASSACAFLEWLFANTDVDAESKATSYVLTTREAEDAIKRGLDIRQSKQAMQVFIQGDTTRTKCRGAANRSLFRHRLFDKNVVGMIAEYMYKNDDSPP